MKIYVASSWRNEIQPQVVKALREAGHEVYDFRNPSETDKGFAWSDIDENWQDWCVKDYKQALKHPIAQSGFMNDFNAMHWADVCVIVLPCGRSAHSEGGWMQGQGKPTIVLQPSNFEPELMYKMFHAICETTNEVIEVLAKLSILQINVHSETIKNTANCGAVYVCSVCGVNPVDAENGYDTCFTCESNF